MTEPDISEHLDRLYSVELANFVAERRAIALALKASGDKEQAKAIESLRKPSLAAWALNQVVRKHRGEVDELLEAQDEMGSASSPAALREAGERRRRLIAQLTGRAVDILTESGHGGEANRSKVEMTLLAVGTDAEAAKAFRAGRLAGDLQPGSSWDVTLAQTSDEPRPKRSAGSTAKRSRDQKELRALVEKAQRLEKRAEQAAQRLKEAEGDAAAAAEAALSARQEADARAAALDAER